MQLKSIIGSKEVLAAQLDLSYSGLAKKLPTNYYNQSVKGTGGKKEYSLLAQHHYHFLQFLAASPRLSSRGVMSLMETRLPDFDRIQKHWSNTMQDFIRNLGDKINVEVHSYTLADLELIGRMIATIPCLVPRPDELGLLDGGPDRVPYIQGLSMFLDNMQEDLQILFSQINLYTDSSEFSLFREAISTARQALSGQISDKEQGTKAFTPTNLAPFISKIHYSNTPYLWMDLLTAMGHQQVKVTDGPNDSNCDVQSSRDGRIILTQVKTGHSPVSSETVRQFANTIRTYNASYGYFITTLRYVRDAYLGQWPRLSKDRRKELRKLHSSNNTECHNQIVEETCRQKQIAQVELIDGQALTNLTLKYHIGRTADGYIDEQYWSSLTIPGFRRTNSVANNPLVGQGERDQTLSG